MTFYPEEEVNWDQFEPDKYIGHNYEQSILEEDIGVLTRLHERTAELTIRRSLGHVANIGHGGAFYADAIVQDLLADDGQYSLIERARPNLAVMERTISQGLQNNDFGVWGKYEDFSVGLSPRYRGGLRRAFRLSKVVSGSIYELEPDQYDAGFSFHCAESITNKQSQYEQAVETYVRSVKRGRLVVMGFMRGSEGYDTPGHFFPAYSVECDDVTSLLEPMLTDLEVIPIIAPKGARPPEGPQYTGIGLATGIRR